MEGFQLVIPDDYMQQWLPRITNLTLLEASAALFALFVFAEIIGALASNSLSLIGDAASMIVDVCTYICNIYVEWCKENFGRLSVGSRAVIEVLVPGISVMALFVVTVYISIDALRVLYNPPAKDDVDVVYLYAYAAGNLLVDIICVGLFCLKADNVFVEAAAVPQLSLDTAISIHDDSDDDDIYGTLETPDAQAESSIGNDGIIDFRYSRQGSLASCDSDLSNNKEHRQEHHGVGIWGQLRTLWGSFCSSTGLCCSSSANQQQQIHQTHAGAGGETSMQHQINQHMHHHVHHHRKNLNMMSAFTHVLGDLLRTIAMLAAAGISSLTGIDGDICDATAALVVAATIIFLCGSLVSEMAGAAMEIWVEEYGDSAPPILNKRYRERKLRLYGSSNKAASRHEYQCSHDLSNSSASHGHVHSTTPRGRGEYTRLSDEEV